MGGKMSKRKVILLCHIWRLKPEGGICHAGEVKKDYS